MYERLQDIKSIILRVANPFGERQRVDTAQGAVGVFLHRAIHDQGIEIWGDGNVTRDYIHISDVAEAFACAINYQGNKSVFNISSGIGTSLNELISLVENILESKVKTRYFPGRPFDVPSSVLSTKLAFRYARA